MAIPVLIAMAAVAAVGAIAGEISKAKSREEAMRLREEMQRKLDEIGDPELKDYVFKEVQSKFPEITTDPRLEQAQMGALQRLQGITDAGGNDAGFRAQMEGAAADTAMRDHAHQQAILSGAQQQGRLNSGLTLAAQLSSASGAADRNRSAGVNAAAEAQQRLLQSIQATGQLAGNIRGQSFQEQSAKAQAADAMARFNAGMGLQTAQAKLAADRFIMDKATAPYGVYGPRDALAQGAQDQQDYSQYGQAGAQAIGGYGMYGQPPKKKEEEV